MNDSADSQSAQIPCPPPPRWPGIVAVLVVWVAVLFTFRSPEITNGNWLVRGIDYTMLHRWRIEFVQQEFQAHGAIPSWYPREFLGSPFWSNLQNFPLTPTRLALLWMDSNKVFTVEANLLALIAATFTYLFARRIGIAIIGSAIAGYTFACSGFYVSRLAAGQIGILEAFASLPVLLWIIHHIVIHRWPSTPVRWYAALGVACAWFAVGAHPQIWVYSFVAAGAYLLWRCRGFPTILRTAAVMVLGLGCMSFILWPMSQLVARSSRMLPLDAPGNDVPLTFARLASMAFPWRDGAPAQIHRPAGVGDISLEGQNHALFWDAVNYVGWLPLIAAGGAVIAAARKKLSRDGAFLLIMSLIALILALPILPVLLGGKPSGIIILRSPVRLMYLVTFALAMGAGVAVDLVGSSVRKSGGAIAIGAMCVIGLLHAFDIYRHDRCFIVAAQKPYEFTPEQKAQIRDAAGDGRVGFDKNMDFAMNRQIDDVGVFDSVLLAGTYQSILDLSRANPKLNVQEVDGHDLGTPALRAAGTKMLCTFSERPDLREVVRSGILKMYEVPSPAARMMYFPPPTVHYFDFEETRRVLRDGMLDVVTELLVPPEAKAALDASVGGPVLDRARIIPYTRPTSDRFELETHAPSPGFVRILEGYDIGWHAMLDDRPVPIFRAHNMAMAVAIPAGSHKLVVEFSTPGRNAGIVMSIVSLGLLSALILHARFKP